MNINFILKKSAGNLYWKDRNGRYLGANDAFLSIIGAMDMSKIIGKSDKDLFGYILNEKQILDLEYNDKYVMQTGKILTLREEGINKQGELSFYQSTKTPILDDFGNIVGMMGTSIDITEIVKTEKELLIAKQKAELANNAKTEFIANMSHDIRTPLSGIVGLGNIIAEEVRDSDIKFKIHDMVRSAEELLEMLNQILDVVSMDDIAVNNIQSKDFDLELLVQSIIDLEKSSVDLKHIELQKTFDSNIPRVLTGDYKKIHHILLNLISNAIKFTEEGYVKITVKLERLLKDAAEIKFVVADTGIGIAKNQLNKIFELFYKVTPSYKGLVKGYGVGLHIVKNYTELLGGKIRITSEINKGSEFSFSLILKIGQGNALERNFSHKALKKTSLISIAARNKKILIIEDNNVALIVAKNLLEQFRCIVTTAKDGETGLVLSKTKKFDLIITDIGLPGISGIEFAQYFRAYEEKHNKPLIPIIALTAHAEGAFYAKCLNVGIDEVIIKPMTFEKTKQLIGKFLSNSNEDPRQKSAASNRINDDLKAISEKIYANDVERCFRKQPSLELDLPENDRDLLNIEKEMIFDIAKAKSILGKKNIDLLMSLVKDTINKVIPEELPRLEKAYLEGEWDKVADICHKLKGGFLSIGLNQAAIACKYFERYHKTCKTKLLEKLYQQVLITLQKTSEKLSEILK